MKIRFVWSHDSERAAFERVVEALMSESLGPLAAHQLLKR